MLYGIMSQGLRCQGLHICVFCRILCERGDTVALLVGHWTCDSRVAGSSPGTINQHQATTTSEV